MTIDARREAEIVWTLISSSNLTAHALVNLASPLLASRQLLDGYSGSARQHKWFPNLAPRFHCRNL